MSTTSPSRRWQHALRTLEQPGPPPPLRTVGWVKVWVVAIVLFWLCVPTLAAVYDLALLMAFGLASLQCLTLPLAIRFPRSAVLLHVACIFLVGTLTRESVKDEPWPMPVANLLALMGILVLLGLREKWIVSVSAWWLGFLAMAVTVLLNMNALTTMSEWGVDMLISVTLTLATLIVSVFLGQRSRVREILAAARRDVELEQARRAIVEERARIARELHDVVAHSMSIVHIQAESARYRIDDLDSARAEFTDIARSARSALGEMRRLLEALHPDDDETFYAPQPTTLDKPALVNSAEKVGSHVAFTSYVEPGILSPVLELIAYRIVQEALSNVIRHAPRARVVVSLRNSSDGVTVRVKNDASSETGSTGRATAEQGGHGLRGMRERVALVDGEIEQTPLPGGGFLIDARLPTTQKEMT